MALIGKSTVAVFSLLLLTAATHTVAADSQSRPTSGSTAASTSERSETLSPGTLQNAPQEHLDVLGSYLDYVIGPLTHLRQKLQSQNTQPNDLDKLDFSLAAEQDPPHPKFMTASPLFARLPTPGDLKKVTNAARPRLVFNLRRVTDSSGTITDSLYAIVPDVLEKACTDYVHGALIETPKVPPAYQQAPFPITLAPDNHQPITDPAPLPRKPAQCIKSADNSLYLFVFLAQRTKPAGSNQWQISSQM